MQDYNRKGPCLMDGAVPVFGVTMPNVNKKTTTLGVADAGERNAWFTNPAAGGNRAYRRYILTERGSFGPESPL